jgi:3-phenylpropionate/cinnamic acid dioxygenase small subunit
VSDPAAVADRLAIHELIAHYGNCLDAGDFDELERLFARDATFEIVPQPAVPGPLRDSRAIRESIEQRWRIVAQKQQRRHVMSNIVVADLEEITASARTVVTVLSVGKSAGSEIDLHGLGVFDDTIGRSDGRWVFLTRRLTMDRVDYFAPGWTSAE